VLPQPCTLLTALYTMHATHFTLHHKPYTFSIHTLHPSYFILAPYTLHASPYTLHPSPYTPHTTHCTPHATNYTLHPTPYTLHPTPYTKPSCAALRCSALFVDALGTTLGKIAAPKSGHPPRMPLESGDIPFGGRQKWPQFALIDTRVVFVFWRVCSWNFHGT
jgi:hypothetical protein